MGREEFEMPMHKVGIKLLADKQIRNVLPSYENLLDRIKKHREEIGKLNGEKFRHYQYNMMYDNVFSVYGKEGQEKHLWHLPCKRVSGMTGSTVMML